MATEPTIAELLARITALEDEVGLTDKRESHKRVQDLKNVYVAYGFTKRYAKTRAWGDEKCGITPAKAEEILIRRGAVKITLDI